jgi:hypothetical protein
LSGSASALAFDDKAFGKRAMHALIDSCVATNLPACRTRSQTNVRHIPVKELWVYAGSSDSIAVIFYRSLGFELLGTAGRRSNDE